MKHTDNEPDAVPRGSELANASVVLMLSGLAGIVTLFITNAIALRLIPLPQWNSIIKYYVVAATITVFLKLGLPESILYFVSRENSRERGLGLFWRTSLLLLCSGAAILSLIFLFPAALDWLTGESSEGLAAPLGAIVLMELGLGAIPPYFVATGRVRLAGGFAILSRIPIGVGLILVAALSGTIAEVMWAIAGGSFLSLVVGWVLVFYTSRGIQMQAPSVPLREQVKFSLPLGASRIAGTANIQMDKFVVMLFFASEFAIYERGATELPLAAMICGATMQALMPSLVQAEARGDRKSFVALWHASIEKISLVVLPLFFFCFVFAEELYVLSFGADFLPSSQLFRIYLLLLLLRVTNYGMLMQALGRTRVPLNAAIIALVLNLILNFAFVHLLGFPGPAIATVAALVASSAYTFWAIGDALEMPLRSIFPLHRYGTNLACAAAAVLPAWVLAGMVSGIVGKLMAGGLLYLGVYLFLCQNFRLMADEDWRFIKGLAKLSFLKEQRSENDG